MTGIEVKDSHRGGPAGVWLLALLFLLVGAGWPLRALADPVGVVLVTRGEVLATREESVRTLGRRDELFVGDLIATGAGARVQFRLDDGETVTLHESTELRIEAFEFDAESGEGESRKTLVEGGLRAVSGALGRHTEVETPVATIGIRGTTYMVAHDDAEGSAAGATRGVINLANATGTDDMDLGEDQDYPYGLVSDPEAPVVGLLERPNLLDRLDEEEEEEETDDDSEEEEEDAEEDDDEEDEDEEPEQEEDAEDDDDEVEAADEGDEDDEAEESPETEDDDEAEEDDDGLTFDDPDDLDDEVGVSADEIETGDEGVTSDVRGDLEDDVPEDEPGIREELGGDYDFEATGRSALIAGPEGAGGTLFAEYILEQEDEGIYRSFIDPDDPEGESYDYLYDAVNADALYSWGHWAGQDLGGDGAVDVYWVSAEPMSEEDLAALNRELAFNSYDPAHDLHGMARTTAAGHFDLEAGVGGVELLFDPMQAEVSGRIDLFREHDEFTEAWWAEFSGELAGAHTHFGELDGGGFTYLAADGSAEELSALAADSHVDVLLITEDVAGGGFHLITADEIDALGSEIQEAVGVFVIER